MLTIVSDSRCFCSPHHRAGCLKSPAESKAVHCSCDFTLEMRIVHRVGQSGRRASASGSWKPVNHVSPSVALEGAVGVYCLRMFYNQPNCCKGLKVYMNGRIFSCRRGNEQCENSWAKSGGSRIGEPRGPKSGGGGLGPSGPIGVYAYVPSRLPFQFTRFLAFRLIFINFNIVERSSPLDVCLPHNGGTSDFATSLPCRKH